MITTIIFDLYGVLCLDPYKAWLSNNNLERTGVYEDLATQVDLGRLDHEGFYSQLSLASGISIAAIKESMAQPPIFDTTMIALVRELKASYAIGLISNGSMRIRQRLTDAGIIDLFDTIIISAEVDLVKPNRAIYELALQQLQATPEETIFIDDNAANSTAATEIGIHGIQFMNHDLLKEELVQLLP